jgi:hypothetical protein
MILIHMLGKSSTTLPMKGLTYLMVTLAYHLAYTELIGCDELGCFVVGKCHLRGAVGLLSVDMLIIIMVEIIVSIVGHET